MRSSGVMRYVGRSKSVQTVQSELSLLFACRVNRFSIGFAMNCFVMWIEGN